MPGAQRAALPGGRWHWQHGPIDLVLQAEGEPAAVAAAHAAAWQRFEGLLAELVTELPLLRQPVVANPAADAAARGTNPLRGPVARSMWAACAPFARHGFITPMAAVAGAVAQALIACYQRPGIQRAWINNGGDIALHLAPGTSVAVGLFADLARLDAAALARTTAGNLPLDGRFTVHAAQAVRGVATSGWRGRSFSLGIADSVTVLAATAAQADAAATVIANAVTVDAPGIPRQSARTLRDDSDLGDIAVTVAVPPLPDAAVQQALAAGRRVAAALQRQGLVQAVALVCQGCLAVLPPVAAPECTAELVQ
ncbi:MAG: hypothetical protein CFE45_11575 [Burkholderiales bacterium PBB5]|nr:MAG: hypothetical protein CFE45_11575 [Burkholderiales bacterium PBB5]